MSSGFFNNIPEKTRFSDVIDNKNFISAPDNWLIVIADVRNSTNAVDTGRYKDVNMIGGAVICAVQNATGRRDWPFVFGGDGATVLIEPDAKSSVEAALVKTRSLAKQEFDLDLIIGFVPVQDILNRGAEVLVARYEISPGNSLAQFGGGGVELAEKLVKSKDNDNNYAVPDYALAGLPDLTGLSCRWEALKTQKGQIVCLLVKPQAQDFQHKQAIVSDFLTQLAEVLGTDISQASPVSKNAIRFSWPPKGLAAEAKITRGNSTYLRRITQLYFESFIQWILERFDLNAANYDAPRYREELRNNSDYCKFDDVLRMVLDCTEEHTNQIRSLLEEMHTQGTVDFGFHATEQALMTCLLTDLKSSQHLHFIDGDDGGLYCASKGLKVHLASTGL